MTVKKLGIRVVAAILLLAILTATSVAAQSNDGEDEELEEMEEYLRAQEADKKSDLKITPTLQEGQSLFNEFSFSDESYDLLSLLNFLFYFLASGGTIWIGIIALVDILKGKSTDAKSIYNDLKGRKSVQGIIITVLSVKVVYVVIDFLFKLEL